jgi:hypothetical protein
MHYTTGRGSSTCCEEIVIDIHRGQDRPVGTDVRLKRHAVARLLTTARHPEMHGDASRRGITQYSNSSCSLASPHPRAPTCSASIVVRLFQPNLPAGTLDAHLAVHAPLPLCQLYGTHLSSFTPYLDKMMAAVCRNQPAETGRRCRVMPEAHALRCTKAGAAVHVAQPHISTATYHFRRWAYNQRAAVRSRRSRRRTAAARLQGAYGMQRASGLIA